MDQLTHNVRRSNWINIIRQCQDRPAGTTAKQWLVENDISEKSYYYWLRKIRREVCEPGTCDGGKRQIWRSYRDRTY